ncbi:MAG: hypothetical protein DRP56_07730 [Planctomycetota bacterium]|nr:MAG: hypothetical protein DRP56_07730 [Planctomycetota bacterium]
MLFHSVFFLKLFSQTFIFNTPTRVGEFIKKPLFSNCLLDLFRGNSLQNPRLSAGYKPVLTGVDFQNRRSVLIIMHLSVLIDADRADGTSPTSKKM